MNTIEPGVLHVGVWDKYFRFNQHSLTKLRECPPSFVWVDNEDDPAKVDVVLATQNSGGVLLGSKHPRKILYLQETSEFHGNRQTYFYEKFDLLLSNDQFLVEHKDLAAKARYQTLFGTWLEKRDLPAKDRGVSLLASSNGFLSGHKLRFAVAKNPRFAGRVDIYGSINGGGYCATEDAYDRYQFNLSIENSNYPWWHTEKLFNCFAAKTVPIYWGCSDRSKLEAWGFDTRGIVYWNGDLDELDRILTLRHSASTLVPEVAQAVEHNFQRAHELWCHEITLEKEIRGFFDLV